MFNKSQFVQLGKYITVQVVAYLFDLGVFIAALAATGAPFISNLGAKCIALGVAFGLHRKYTFEVQGDGATKQGIYYFALGAAVSIAASLLLLFLNKYIPSIGAKLLSDVILFFAAFLISKLFIFRKK